MLVQPFGHDVEQVGDGFAGILVNHFQLFAFRPDKFIAYLFTKLDHQNAGTDVIHGNLVFRIAFTLISFHTFPALLLP